MKDTTIIRVLLLSQGLFETTLSRRIGKSKNAIHNRLHKDERGHMRTDVFNTMVSALDYKVVVMPSTGRLPEGAYVLTNEDAISRIPKEPVIQKNYEDIEPDAAMVEAVRPYDDNEDIETVDDTLAEPIEIIDLNGDEDEL